MTPIDEAVRLAGEGWTFLQSGKAHEAEQRFRQALAIHKDSPTALHGLALIGHQTGNLVPALALFERALVVDPRNPALFVNRGNSLAALQRYGEAIASFQQALVLAPGLKSAMVNMATALHAGGRLDEAVETLEQVCAAQPTPVDALNNLGNLYKDQGRLDKTLDCYQRALAIGGMQQQTFSNLLSALKVDNRIGPAQMLEKHKEWSCWFEMVSAQAPLLRNSPEPDRVVRIGYVSPDCHTALPAFIDAVIAGHDRKKFLVFCYFNNPQDPKKLAVLGIGETSRVLRGADDQQVAQLIHADGIDILVDIAGHTGHNRLGVFARRPAPVQITWLDYLCTTGLEAMDYRITDAIADPPGYEAFHSEKLLRMPHSQWCWQPAADSPPVSALPALTNRQITFGSFNNAQKLTDATLSLWRRMLAAMPDAHLQVAGIPEGWARHRIGKALAVDAGRLTFLPRLAVKEYRQALSAVDIALDPMPFSGATTTLDALWQGVPVLTLPGATSCSRSTASLLTTLGLAEFIARDEEDFVRRAQQLSARIDSLAAMRRSMRERMQGSPILDVPSFVGNLEELFAQTWRHWCDENAAVENRLVTMSGSSRALTAAAAQVASGQYDDAIPLLISLLKLRPQWELVKHEWVRACLVWAQSHAEVKAAWRIPFTPLSSTAKVSAIVCSIRPDYFDGIKRQLEQQFARHDFELIGIHDAKSLCEAYNRGAAQAKGDILIFCHDDIDIVNADFGERLLRHLQTQDLVGVAGTTKLVNAEWVISGPPFAHGQIIHKQPGQQGYLYYGIGLQAPVVEGVQALDGVMLAMHRKVWEAIRFDEVTFDGFHCYDIDFTYRCYRAGMRLAVPMDLLLIHFSAGRYDEVWQTYNARLLDKFPDLSNLPGMRRLAGLHVKLQTLEQVERLHTALFHHNFGASTSIQS
jgi:protein O-GlcNAc transferase